MKIDINEVVYDLIKDNDKLKKDLISLGFTGLGTLMTQPLSLKYLLSSPIMVGVAKDEKA